MHGELDSNARPPASSFSGFFSQMSYSLNSLKGGYIKDYIGTTTLDIKGDARSSEYSSYPGLQFGLWLRWFRV